MLTKSKIALGVAIILGAASASPAKDSGPPKIDIQKTCRENVGALGIFGTSEDDFKTCMNDEETAHEQLIKDWATYPPLAKTRCVLTKEYLPGYVEWQACIEMTRDVLQLRKQQSAPVTEGSNTRGKPSSRRAGSESKECPIVKTEDDGSIAWIINC